MVMGRPMRMRRFEAPRHRGALHDYRSRSPARRSLPENSRPMLRNAQRAEEIAETLVTLIHPHCRRPSTSDRRSLMRRDGGERIVL